MASFVPRRQRRASIERDTFPGALPMSRAFRQLTDEEIIEALAACQGLISRAARRLGCTARTIYYRRAKNPEIDRAILEARAQLIDDAEEGLRHHLAKRAPWAIAMVLKTLGKSRGYVERIETREVSDETLLLALEREREIERVRRLGEGEVSGAKYQVSGIEYQLPGSAGQEAATGERPSSPDT